MPYRLTGTDGRPYESDTPGGLGGHRRSRIYGRLDCPSAARAIARGGPHPAHRVFFATEADAVSAGYRPCAVCLPHEHARWRADCRIPTPPEQPPAAEAGGTPEE